MTDFVFLYFKLCVCILLFIYIDAYTISIKKCTVLFCLLILLFSIFHNSLQKTWLLYLNEKLLTWHKGLLLNVFHKVSRSMTTLISTESKQPDQIYCGSTNCNIGIVPIVYIMIYTICSWPFFSLFVALFFEIIPKFLHRRTENYTKTNNCTDCVNTEYWGKHSPSFFCMESIKLISITKINHVMTKCKKTLRYF